MDGVFASPDAEARESEEQQCEEFRIKRRGVEARALLEVFSRIRSRLDAERSAQRIEERVTEIIDVRQQYDDSSSARMKSRFFFSPMVSLADMVG